MINIILLGAPGAGKGTQANRLSKAYNLTHISTGDVIREEIRNNTNFGKKVKSFADKGLLVPDELIIEIIESRLHKEGNGYLLDGFPRNLKQAISLDTMIREKKLDYPYIFYIEVTEDELVKRLTNRRYCPKCNKIYSLINNAPENNEICDKCRVKLLKRKDDEVTIIKKRFEVFKSETYPLLEYYSKSEKFYKVEGDSSEDKVYKSIVDIIK